MTTVVAPTYSVDQIVAAHRRGELSRADAVDALRWLGVANPALFIPPQTNPIRVTPSPLLATRRTK